MGYHCRDEAHFLKIYSYFEKAYKKAELKARPGEAKILIQALKDDPNEFKAAISWGEQSSLGDFTRKPFLHCLDVNEFIGVLFSIDDISMRHSICGKIRDRFQISGVEVDLKKELPWLRNLGLGLSKAGVNNPESFEAQTFAVYGKDYQNQAKALSDKLKNKTKVIASE